MKIYIVSNGYYADFNFVKLFTDKRKAEIYCAVHNEKHEDYYYIEPCEIDDVEVDDSIQCVYKYEFRFSLHLQAEVKYTKLFCGTHIFIDKGQVNNIAPNDCKIYGDFYYFQIYLKEENMDKANKIADDMIAQFIAEREGI